ncbi:MAG: hypothetical protein JJE16_07950 [Nitrospiraceae bacterium]|nr:hypothetical protein [Nitrospiraceae bacterium]
MFTKTILAKTNMLMFWQYLFNYCNEDFTCVLGWVLAGIMGFLAVLMSLVLLMKRLNKEE